MMEMSYKPAQGRPGRSTPTAGPFGYPAPLDTPYDSAPLPHGPALLDDTEASMLDNFFSTMNDSHFDNADFWFGLETDKPFGFEWQEELPPTFEGSTTSLPPQYLPATPRSNQGSMAHGKNNAPLTSDVIEAASTLYQNGAVPHDFMSNFTEQVFTENGLEDVGHVLPAFKRARLGYGPDGSAAPVEDGFFDKGMHTANARFGPQGGSARGAQPSRKADPLRWGSDAGFSTHRYEAPPDHETEEDRTKELLTHLDCLEAQSSAANTRPSSPTRRPADPTKADWDALRDPQGMKPFIDNDRALLDDGTRPRKRRKSKSKGKDNDMEIDIPVATHHFPTAKDRRLSSTMDALPRRLKGSSSIAKHPRENLTEEQKRTNHILSEQRRRNLIKQGFDDLCTLVPDLHGGGYSKSTMLIQAGDWLEQLINGNELLKAQLAELNGQSSTTNANE